MIWDEVDSYFVGLETARSIRAIGVVLVGVFRVFVVVLFVIVMVIVGIVECGTVSVKSFGNGLILYDGAKEAWVDGLGRVGLLHDA